MYFIDVTNLEQAKLRYRKLAKQLHPDTGGKAIEFQKMQNEYKTIVKSLQQNCTNVNGKRKQSTPDGFSYNEYTEADMFDLLSKLASRLIEKQVPQNYLRQKIKTTNSSLLKGALRELVGYLDEM
jgi:DnaJ-class molecular chaperone